MSESRKLKHFCIGPPEYGLNIPASEYLDAGIRFLRTTDINADGSLTSDAAVFVDRTAVTDDRHQLEDGDILLSRSGTLGRCLRYQKEHGPTSYAGYLVRFRPRRDVDPRFLQYCAQTRFFEQAIEADAVTSTISNFNAEKYANLPLPWHRYSEQGAIADYLDTETARIDALIAKKRRMIELLGERCRILIATSVTRGLDERTSFRDVDISFVDATPSHWALRRLSSLCDFQSGKAHEQFIDPAGEFICVNSRFVSTGGTTVKRCTHNFSPAKKSDVLMVMSDLPNGRALAKAYFVDDDRPFAVNQRVCVITAHSIDPKFAFYQLDRNPLFLSYNDGSNQTHLPNSVFTKFKFLVPPIAEQRAIVSFLDDAVASLRGAIRAIDRQIELLAERRQALITAAVTGELEIPGVAA